MDFPSVADLAERPFTSTKHLPEPDPVQQLMTDAHNRFKSNGEGAA